MIRYLLDTNAFSDLMNDRRGVAERAALERSRGNQVGLCTIVQAELIDGIENSDDPEEQMKLFKRIRANYRCWPFDSKATYVFGKIKTVLRRRNQLTDDADLMIASISLVLSNCIVDTRDAHFSRVPGLVVENWATSY